MEPPSRRALADPWDPFRRFPLDGVLERNAYAPGWMAVLALLLCFVLFQVLISPLAVVAFLLAEGVAPDELLAAMTTDLAAHGRSLISANTIGQYLGLAVPAYLLARMSTTRPAALLRLRAPDPALLALGLAGLFALLPVVEWLGSVNSTLPLPEWLREFEQQQLDLIAQLLGNETNVPLNLFMLALTPAFCEELLFRGYVQRQGERAFGAAAGIAFSGILFGLYHLRITQVVPLSLLGVYLAYLAWRTGSLWAPVVVHFANNAFAVALGAYVARHPELGIEDVEQLNLPWYLAVLGAALFVGIVVMVHRRAEGLLAASEAANQTAATHLSYTSEEAGS